MGVNDWGSSGQTLSTPSLSAWAQSVAAVLESDVTITTRLAGKSDTSHTHTSGNVTDFNEAVDDRVGALLVQGSNVTLTYNDAANTLTIAATNTVYTFGRVPRVSSFMGPSFVTGVSAGAVALGSGVVPGAYFQIHSQISIDQLGFRVTTLEAAMLAKALLYSSDSSGHPTTLVANSGALSCATATDVMGTITPVVLTPGIYWGFIRSNAGVAVRFQHCYQTPTAPISATLADLASTGNYLTADPGTYATPATIAAWVAAINGTNASLPLVYMRRSA